jgi:hypothetical protein
VTARALVNDWYTRLPDEDGAFVRRLRSVNDAHHQTALDELFVHERLKDSGDVVYEEGGLGPDFRIYRDSEYFAGVEVLSLFMRSDWANEQVRHDRISDALNKRLSADRWFIHFEIVRLDRPPAIRKLAMWVQRTIDDLPPHEPVPMVPFDAPGAVYEEDGVRLDFEFVPRSATLGVTGDRIVGRGPVIGGRVNSRERLQTALHDKGGGRYDLKGRPFALFVAVHDSFCDLDDVEAALYGRQGISTLSFTAYRSDDGFFGQSDAAPAGKNKRVSCLFTLMNWQPWDPEAAPLFRLDNPFADVAFPDDVIVENFRYAEISRDDTHFQLGWAPHPPPGARNTE